MLVMLVMLVMVLVMLVMVLVWVGGLIVMTLSMRLALVLVLGQTPVFCAKKCLVAKRSMCLVQTRAYDAKRGRRGAGSLLTGP